MINIALAAVRRRLENLEVSDKLLIEKYGGLVFPVSIPEEIGQTATGEPILKEKVFPVACGVNFQECIMNRRYQELTPNSSYSSIAYWEQLGDAVINQAEAKFAPKGGLIVYDIPVRFVFWGSVPKLNMNSYEGAECSFAAPIALRIQQELYNKQGISLDNPLYPNARAEFIFQGMEAKDATKIFGRYSYGKELMKFMFWPYDFFAIKYLVRLKINRHCIADFTLGTAETCPVLTTFANPIIE